MPPNMQGASESICDLLCRMAKYPNAYVEVGLLVPEGLYGLVFYTESLFAQRNRLIGYTERGLLQFALAKIGKVYAHGLPYPITLSMHEIFEITMKSCCASMVMWLSKFVCQPSDGTGIDPGPAGTESSQGPSLDPTDASEFDFIHPLAHIQVVNEARDDVFQDLDVLDPVEDRDVIDWLQEMDNVRIPHVVSDVEDSNLSA